jgi:hypothetical protein
MKKYTVHFIKPVEGREVVTWALHCDDISIGDGVVRLKNKKKWNYIVPLTSVGYIEESNNA